MSEADDQALDACISLWSAACGGRDGVVHRCARLTPLQVAADKATYAKRTAEEREKADLQRLALASLACLPREWRGKRYRRTEGQSTEHAREEGERQERLRQGRQVAALLVEANLPFARALGAQALEQEAPLRCCRGLRADTLAQRLACCRPFSRWLTLRGYGPFPTSEEMVLEYLDLRASENAPRTALASLISSLRFERLLQEDDKVKASITVRMSSTLR